MNIHEYQAKQLLSRYGVPVLKGGVAYTPAEAESVAKELNGPIWVVKSQIHAGGRGKGRFKEHPDLGGVRVVKSVEDVKENARQMLGSTLVTHQTGPHGKTVKRVYIEDGCDIERELYLSLLIDRKTSRVTVIASSAGGMDIEEVAAKTPDKILTIDIDPVSGMQGFHARQIAYGLGLKGEQVGGAEVSQRHANFFIAHPGATAKDVLQLIDVVRNRVAERMGVELETEIEIW